MAFSPPVPRGHPHKPQTERDPRRGEEGRGGTKRRLADSRVPRAGRRSPSVLRVSRDNLGTTLCGRGDGYSDSRPRGHGRLPQGPIESLGGPICKDEGREDPRLGGEQIGVPVPGVGQPMGAGLLAPRRNGPARVVAGDLSLPVAGSRSSSIAGKEARKPGVALMNPRLC